MGRAAPLIAATAPLIESGFGVRRVPWGDIFEALLSGSVVCLFFFCSCAGAVHSLRDLLLLASLALPAALIAFAVRSLPSMREAMRTRVAVDEGGVRFVARGITAYVPFDQLSGAHVDERSLRGPATLSVLDRTGRALLTVGLFGSEVEGEAALIASTIVGAVGKQRRVAMPSPLQRHGRPLAAYREGLIAEARRLGPATDYRDQGLDLDALAEEACDRSVHPDDRAALACFVCATLHSSARARVEASLGEATPPPVVLLSGIAPPSLVEAALPYVDDDLARLAPAPRGE